MPKRKLENSKQRPAPASLTNGNLGDSPSPGNDTPKIQLLNPEALAKNLNDPELRVCAAAAQALGRVGGPDATVALIAGLNDQPSVRTAVVEALGPVGGPEVTEALASLNDPELRVRAAAALPCRRAGRMALIAGLNDHDTAVVEDWDRSAAQRSSSSNDIFLPGRAGA